MTGLSREEAGVRATPRADTGSRRLSRLFRRLPLHLTIFVIMAVVRMVRPAGLFGRTA